MSKRWSTVVVGAGIVGLSVARSLVERGVSDVLVLEQMVPAAAASGLGAGSVHTQRWRVLDIDLVARTKDILHRLAPVTGGMTALRPSGRLTLVAGEDGSLLRRYSELIEQRAGGISVLSADDVRERWPFLMIADDITGAFTGTDGVVSPPAVCWAFANLIRQGGGTIWEGTRARRLVNLHDGARVELADGSSVDADVVVVAAGPWSAELLANSGSELPDTRVETQTTMVRVDGTSATWRVPNILDVPNGESTIIPRNPGTLCIGGFVGWSRRGEETSSALFGATSDDTYNESVRELVSRRFQPGVVGGVVGGWRGVVDVTPDRLPLVGAVPGIANTFVACGFGGYGVQRGPAVGEVLADRLLGFPERIDVSSCDPSRYIGYTSTPDDVRHDTDNAFSVRVGR